MYSPFGKNIDELTASDLFVLEDIPEGWYVEYKKEPCKSKDYAKEVSAFANAYGGWLFIGLEEDSSSGKPIGGPGLPSKDSRRLSDAARDAVTQNCSPSPFFEIHIVEGPIPALLIESNRSLLIIHVPQSENTPHIHSSGKVYVRQADKAESKGVQDRGELDKLYARGERLHQNALANLKRGFDKNWAREFTCPWCYFALVPNPAYPHSARAITLEQFRRFISQSRLQLPDIYPSALGFVARDHSLQTNLTGVATTLEYGLDGSLFMITPMSNGPAWLREEQQPNEFLKSSDLGFQMAVLIAEKQCYEALTFDASSLFSCINTFYQQSRDLLSAVEMGKNYIARVEVINLLRCIPYFRSSAYVEWCKQHTIPVLHRGEIEFPQSKEKFFEIQDVHQDDFFLRVLVTIVQAFGVPSDLVAAVMKDTLA